MNVILKQRISLRLSLNLSYLPQVEDLLVGGFMVIKHINADALWIRTQFYNVQTVCLSLHLFTYNNPAVTGRIFMKCKIEYFSKI
jgi:hypothetical protein